MPQMGGKEERGSGKGRGRKRKWEEKDRTEQRNTVTQMQFNADCVLCPFETWYAIALGLVSIYS